VHGTHLSTYHTMVKSAAARTRHSDPGTCHGRVVVVVVVVVVGGGGGGGTVVGVVVAVGPVVGVGAGGDDGDGADVGRELVADVVSLRKRRVVIPFGCRAGVVVRGPTVLSNGPAVVVVMVGVVVDVLVGVRRVGVKIGATATSGSLPPPLSIVKGKTASTTTAMPAPTRATTRNRSWVSGRSSPVGPRPGWPLDEGVVMPKGSVSNVASQ